MRTGINAVTGQVIQGWAHCVQSMATIFTTRIGSRVMLRHFGSGFKDIQDANATPRVILELYTAAVEALLAWEPGFRPRTLHMVRGGPDGRFVFIMPGIFYPFGHRGDFSVTEEREASFLVSAGGTFTPQGL